MFIFRSSYSLSFVDNPPVLFHLSSFALDLVHFFGQLLTYKLNSNLY